MPVGLNRRAFLTTLGSAAAWPVAVRTTKAQDAGQIPHIGWIFPGASGNSTELAGFKEGLRELGYVEGTNILV